MVVQHNLTAMNSNRMLGITQAAQSKSSEKLSSGYKINRAADDAAGLSISEKMRKQIKGLDKAATNAQDGVSAVQTAEGALTEVHSMLQRMNELAVQSANGTNSEDDRAAIQAEIDQLVTEIDRVAETTKFNETYLLKGTDATTTKTIAAHDAGLKGKLTANADGTSTFAIDKALQDGDKVTIAGTEYTIGKTKIDADFMAATTANNMAITLGVGDSITVDGQTKEVVNKLELDVACGTGTIGSSSSTIGWAAGDQFVDSKGVTWTIVDDTANSITLGTSQGDATKENVPGVSGYVEISDVSDKLDNGSKIIKNALHKEVNGLEVVTKLENDEYSIVDSRGTAATLVASLIDSTNGFQEGDKITINATKTTKTITDETVESFADIKDAINDLADGTVVTIISDNVSTEYTVVGNDSEVDADKKKLTREQIAGLIKEYDEILVSNYNPNRVAASSLIGGAATLTVYGVSETSKEGTITADDAYKMMAEELAKASSIGTDKAATVKNNNDGTFTINQGSVEVKEALNFNLHVGADADMTNKINVDIESMSAANLGIKGISVSDDSGVNATYAIDAIADALAKVSEQRSALGAIQNRLEHTIANLDNVVENTTAAESRIRDTDMAEEMVEYSKNNILAQAGQSMLAQANQSTQGVLSLLG